jgi:hypothetical protein
MEAQAFRTRVRLQDLERAAHNGEGTHQDQEDMLPDDDSELRILRSFVKESPTYPNTEARQNVTVRRSRDRLSGRSSEIRTPEAVTGRRSSLRERDRRYSLEASQKMPANTFARDNEEELRASYQDVNLRPDDSRQISSSPGEIEERVTPHRTATGHQVSGSGSKVIELLNRPRLKESRKTSSPDVLLSPPGFFASSSSEQEQSSSPHLGDDEAKSENESDSDDGTSLPLFTRRDIPEESEDPDTHELLLTIWQRRKDASELLVQAMEEDDVEAFEELERQVRYYNRQMFQTKTHYEKQKMMKLANDRYLKAQATKFVAVDDLSFDGDNHPSLARSTNKGEVDDFRILLTYQGNQVFRKPHP